MNKEDLKETVRELEQRVEKLERGAQPARNQEHTNDVAQEAHEAALTSFQTKRLGNMNVSLNGAPISENKLNDVLDVAAEGEETSGS